MNHVTATDKTKLYDFLGRRAAARPPALDPSSQTLDVPNLAHRALQVIMLG